MVTDIPVAIFPHLTRFVGIKAAKLPASFSYIVENRRNFFSHPKHRSTTFSYDNELCLTPVDVPYGTVAGRSVAE